MSVAELEGVTKRYGAITALDGVTFAVEAGDVVALLGPNGAGKSTALNAILGLTAHQGELKVLKGIAAEITSMRAKGQGVLIVDDLVDTGKTARVVREILPAAHFATVYAKPMGRPQVDTFITEVSQDTWIYFPWDTALAFAPPIREGGD